MKQIPITRPVNLSLLTEQLFDAFPQWRRMGRVGWVTDVVVTSEEISFPVDTDLSAVQAVIDAHDPNGQSINQKRKNLEKDLAERIERHFPQFTIEELRLMFPRIEFEDV